MASASSCCSSSFVRFFFFFYEQFQVPDLAGTLEMVLG
jgi:hypothetical protein